MKYVTYTQLVKDVVAWSAKLPQDIDAFCGVPRSGLLVANLLALHRNGALIDLDGCIMGAGQRYKERGINKIMLVDDSLLSGRSFAKARKQCAFTPNYEGVMYIAPGKTIQYYYATIPVPRIFEWNVFHGYWIKQALVDIDGVVCRDPTSKENDDGANYLHFLEYANPRYIPTVTIDCFVTNRLERYRPQTEAWLQKHGIKYNKLIMHPARTKAERVREGDHASRKALIYRQSKAPLFIESSERQAKIIFETVEKPVLCVDTNELYS